MGNMQSWVESLNRLANGVVLDFLSAGTELVVTDFPATTQIASRGRTENTTGQGEDRKENVGSHRG